jgi:hypothetical protein
MGHEKKCKHNIEVAAAFLALLEQGNAADLVKLFASDGELTYHGDKAKVGLVNIIPYSGTFEGALGVTEFVNLLLEFANLGTFSNLKHIFAGDCGLYAQADLTLTPKCELVVGEEETLSTVLKFTFTKCSCIKSVDIYNDTSALALFYNENCPPL